MWNEMGEKMHMTSDTAKDQLWISKKSLSMHKNSTVIWALV